MNLVRCLKCEKVVNCSRYDTACLLRHIETDHPNVKLENYREQIEQRRQEEEQNMNQIDFQRPDAIAETTLKNPIKEDDPIEQNMRMRNYKKYQHKHYAPSSASSGTHRSHGPTFNDSMLYRASIANWSPGSGCIYCPKCGHCKKPTIEDGAESCASHGYWSSCMLSCWPLCYLPCVKPCSRTHVLYCSECNNFLGIYDRTANCVKINPDYSMNGKMQERFRRLSAKKHTQRLLTDDQHEMELKGQTIELNAKNRLPHIVIDGKELHPDIVRRLQKYKKYGTLVGIDLEAVKDDAAEQTANNAIKEANESRKSN